MGSVVTARSLVEDDVDSSDDDAFTEEDEEENGQPEHSENDTVSEVALTPSHQGARTADYFVPEFNNNNAGSSCGTVSAKNAYSINNQ